MNVCADCDRSPGDGARLRELRLLILWFVSVAVDAHLVAVVLSILLFMGGGAALVAAGRTGRG